MRYLSLFSGLGGAELAFSPLGWECVGVSEIDPAACVVLQHHYPNVPNLGNVDNIKADEWKGNVDLLIGGAPCQAFSVAGLRKSLGDARGNLTLKYVELTHAIDPQWTVFENVPGILSTKDNAFGCFLGGMVGSDTELVPARGQRWTDSGVVTGPKRTAAWRILDAQYMGVAQRRRRVFVVTVRGARNWSCAAALLPLSNGLQRHPPPRKEKGERVAGCLKGDSGECGWPDPSDGNGGGMVELGGTSGRGDGDGSGESIPKWPAEIASTLDARYGKNYGQENQHINSGASHFVPVAYRTNAAGQVDPQGDKSAALTSNTDPCTQILAFDTTQVTSKTNRSNPQVGDPCHTLAKGSDAPAIVYMVEQNTQASTPEFPSLRGNKTPNYAVAYDQYNGGESDKAFSVTSGTGTASHNIFSSVPVVMTLGHTTSNGLGITETETANTLEGVSSGNQAVAWHIQDQNTGKSIKAKSADVSTCLGTRDLSKYQGTFNADVIQSVMQVRRLTPVECSRLQGVPDSYLDIPYKGKTLTDGLKYKLLGNGFAVPVVRYIGKRIKMVEELTNGIS